MAYPAHRAQGRPCCMAQSLARCALMMCHRAQGRPRCMACTKTSPRLQQHHPAYTAHQPVLSLGPLSAWRPPFGPLSAWGPPFGLLSASPAHPSGPS
eukprot:353783-Chlamydomonas_euryale.AAC.13